MLDFGISKLLEDTRITQVAVGMGSAEYMSPEQMRSAGDVDTRTDLWSLGVTLYELCTGATPFHAESIAQVGAAVLVQDPAPPRQRRPDLPAGLEAVILRCLDKDPDRRFASAADLGAALEPFTSATPAARSSAAPPISAPRPIPPTRAFAAFPAPPAPPAARPAGGAASGFSVLAGVAIAVVAVVLVAVAFVVGRGGGSGASSAASRRFELDAGTLYDGDSKLTWQRKPAPGSMDWASAKGYCARQGRGFRLPEVEELTGLLAAATAESAAQSAELLHHRGGRVLVVGGRGPGGGDGGPLLQRAPRDERHQRA